MEEIILTPWNQLSPEIQEQIKRQGATDHMRNRPMSEKDYQRSSFFITKDGKLAAKKAVDDYLTNKAKQDFLEKETALWKKTGPYGTVYYQVPTSSGGGFGIYYNPEDAYNAYTRAKENGRFSDASENLGNDILFDLLTGKGILKGGYQLAKGLVKAAPKAFAATTKAAGKAISGQISKEALTQAAKSAGKSAWNFTREEAPKLATSMATGFGVDVASKEFTGKTWGENVAEGLSQRWGFKVPTWVGEVTNPGYSYGYKVAGRTPRTNVTPTNIEPVNTELISAEGTAPVEANLGEALQNISREDLRAMLNRFRAEAGSQEGSVTSRTTEQLVAPSSTTEAPAAVSSQAASTRAVTPSSTTQTSTRVVTPSQPVQVVTPTASTPVRPTPTTTPVATPVATPTAATPVATPTASTPVVTPTAATPVRPVWEDSAQLLRDAGFREIAPGVFKRRYGEQYNLNIPRQYAIRNNSLIELNLHTPNDIRQILDATSGITPISRQEAQIIQNNPHVLQYRKDVPFTMETLPGLNRTHLAKGYDTTHMSHFPDDVTGGFILDDNGFLRAHTVNGGLRYEDVMAQEFNQTPHGASIGFNTDWATSTSSTPMFWLQLRRGLQNKSLARVYIPENGQRYILNEYGRAYRLNNKGKMVSVPGTENYQFNMLHMPEYIGSKNVKYTLPDGTTRNILQLPDGTYLGPRGTKTADISYAIPAYYNNGCIYNGTTHRVMFPVDQPFLTREEFVEHLNNEYILPLFRQAGITAEPAKVVGRGSEIEVPSIAGIRFQKGGSIIKQFKRNRRCKKN